MPLSTRPLGAIPGLSGKNLVSVYETKTKGAKFRTRVYRYTFAGNYSEVVRRFQQKLLAKDGWQTSSPGPNEGDFWRTLPKGSIEMQGLLVFDARLIRSGKSATGWTPLPPNRSRGWVWVSYNERLRR